MVVVHLAFRLSSTERPNQTLKADVYFHCKAEEPLLTRRADHLATAQPQSISISRQTWLQKAK